MLVTVDAAAQGNLRIVDVQDGDTIEANGAVHLSERGGQSGFGLDVVTGGEEMRGVQASTNRQTRKALQDFCNLFQARTDCAPHSRGVLDQNLQSAEV
jgi:hypothetical protein